MMLDSHPYLKLHFIVILWGFTAVLGLLINLPFIELVADRTFIASVGLAAIMFFMRLRFLLPPREVLKILLTGSIIALHWLLFFGAARYSNASVSLIGLSTTTIWTALIEPLIRRRRISKVEVVFGLMVIFGLYIIYSDDFEYGLGLLMSLGSALLAAIFSILNHGFVRRHHPVTIAYYEMVGAFLTTLPLVFIFRQPDGILFHTPSTSDWGYLLILSLVCTVYANAESINVLKQLSAFASNLVINLEPVYGIILALLFFGQSEQMTSKFYLGGSILMITILAYPYFSRKMRFRGH